MNELLEWMDYIEDTRQQRKVRHKLKDIIVIVFFATLATVDDWVEMEYFAHYHEEYLKKYIELKNGIPSHDTLSRVFGMLSPEILQQLYRKWQEHLDKNEGKTLKKLICVDGKTMRGNKRKDGKPNHIITAWNREDSFSLGQKVVDTKSNEITAIPELLEKIHIKGQIVTIDAMGTQTAIAEKIRAKHADYVLVLKENQKSLCEDVALFLMDEHEKEKLRKRGSYKRTIEKAHRQTEIREYYETEKIAWLMPKKGWKGLKSIGMEEKTIWKEGKEKKEYRYYISSLKEDIEQFSRAVRGHWSIESMHWHLDVTFKEDANTTLDKQAAENLNIIRKWCLGILKMVEIFCPNLSMKKKRFVISMNPAEFLEQVLAFKKRNCDKEGRKKDSCVCRGNFPPALDMPRHVLI